MLSFYTFTWDRVVPKNFPMGQRRMQGTHESLQGAESGEEESKRSQKTLTWCAIHSAGERSASSWAALDLAEFRVGVIYTGDCQYWKENRKGAKMRFIHASGT